MSITIVTTASGSTSNSYATLAEATAYLEAVPWFYATWAALTTAVQNSWLVFATRAIDRMNFRGDRYDSDQSLKFPRTITDDRTDEGDVPQAVKDAQCEMIVWLYKHIDTSDGSPERQINSLGLGNKSLEIRFDEKRSPEYILAGGYPDSVRGILRDFLISPYNIELLRG